MVLQIEFRAAENACKIQAQVVQCLLTVALIWRQHYQHYLSTLSILSIVVSKGFRHSTPCIFANFAEKKTLQHCFPFVWTDWEGSLSKQIPCLVQDHVSNRREPANRIGIELPVLSPSSFEKEQCLRASFITREADHLNALKSMIQHQHLTISNESIALSSVLMNHSIVRIDLKIEQLSTSSSTSSHISPFGFCISLGKLSCYRSASGIHPATSAGMRTLPPFRRVLMVSWVNTGQQWTNWLCAFVLASMGLRLLDPGFVRFHLPRQRTILSSHPDLASKKHCSRTVRAAEIALHHCEAQLPLAESTLENSLALGEGQDPDSVEKLEIREQKLPLAKKTTGDTVLKANTCMYMSICIYHSWANWVLL